MRFILVWFSFLSKGGFYGYLTSSTKALYRKYLIASLGSALVITIYSFVDTIAVGQSEGPAGTAAMAVISPVFGILVFLGILFGIGGSVLMNNAKGEGNEEKGNAYFTMALLLMIGFTVLTWVLFAVCSNPILCFFGRQRRVAACGHALRQVAHPVLASVPLLRLSWRLCPQ